MPATCLVRLQKHVDPRSNRLLVPHHDALTAAAVNITTVSGGYQWRSQHMAHSARLRTS